MCNRFSSESWTTLLVSLPPWRALMKTTNSKNSNNSHLAQSLPEICSISVFVSAILTVIRQLSSNQLHYQIPYRTKTENTMFCVLESGQPASCFMLAAPRFKLPYQTSLAILSNARKDRAPYYKLLQSDSTFSFKLITILQIYYIY